MKKRAFTLIELLAIIAIIGVIMGITIPSVFNVINKSKTRAFNSIVSTIEANANYYVSKYKSDANTAIASYGHYDITLQQLIDEGLMKSNVNDPRTDQPIPLTKKVVVTKTINGAFAVCYEDNKDCSGNIYLSGNFSPTNASANEAPGSYISKNNSNYFVGQNPNNWIQFGQVSSSDTTPLLWRIIKNDNTGIKIIYEGVKNGINPPADNGRIQIGGSWVAPWDTSNSNKWERPATIKALLQTWYNNLYVINKDSYVAPIKWCISGISGGDPVTLSQFLSDECVDKTAAGGVFQGKTASTTAIGFLNPGEYISASSAPSCVGGWQSDGNHGAECGTINGTSTNFLYKSSYNYWTNNVSDGNTSSVWIISANGWTGTANANDSTSYFVRPVINLNPKVFYSGGTGSLADPYRIGVSATNTDTTPPVIAMNGIDYITVDIGSIYNDAGATATDNIDGIINTACTGGKTTDCITSTGTVNTNVAGTYNIVYSVSDNAGNVATKTRTIDVFEYNYAYDYTGGYQTFTVPYTGNYQVELWGAQGGSTNPGKGAYTKGSVNLTKDQNFYVYVGQQLSVANGTSFNGGTATFSGCPGGGATDIRVNNQKYRYVRDYLNGNSLGGANHWVEIQAFDLNGTNVALNKTVTGSSPDSYPGRPYTLVTDGSLDSSLYTQAGTNGLQYVEVDLGAEYTISSIKVWHYYTDGRIYHSTKTVLYSADQIAQLTINDSASNGEYAETASGRTYDIGLRSRIMVAAGGGAGTGGIGGYGGALTGGNGLVATGGIQTAGGTQEGTYGNGTFGYGGGGCGGGGGYYGGGGATCANGGGGGSSFISGYTGCNAINSLGIATNQTNHYSNYNFSTTIMAAGNASMPNPRGTGNITGNTGNGYAKITYLP